MSFVFRASPYLPALVARLREAPRRVHEEVARSVEVGLLRVIDEQFQAAQDPSGRPWLPPRDGHRPTMQRSGALRGGWSVRAVVDERGLLVRISNSTDYAKYLQTGTWKMAPRVLVPGPSLMAPAWRRAVRDAYSAALHRWLSGS